MGLYNYAVVNLLIDSVHKSAEGISKDILIAKLNKSFRLVKDRSVYSCDAFALRVCTSKTNSFSNTVLSLSALQKHDDKPFIVVLVTPSDCIAFLSNTTFLKKISHSSKELRVDNIKGSFNGSDISREYNGLENAPENFAKLFAIHQAFTWEENIERLVEATNNISPSKTKYFIDERSKGIILTAPNRAKSFIGSDDFTDLSEDLTGRADRVKDSILIAAFIDNVNLRGRVIEELVTTDDPKIIQAIAKKLKDGESLSLRTDQKLGDYTKKYERFWTETDIKTKVLFLQSAPKAYNIDKLLEFLAEPNSVYLFFLIGINSDNSIKTRLVSVFEKRLLVATKIQHHWAGRNTRGVTQFDGHALDEILSKTIDEIDVNNAIAFLEELIDL
jgi:hypothetical protein